MKNISIIFSRELASYFSTPIAYVFLVIFLLLSGSFTFYMGNFYERGQADLLPFFGFHPWLYLFLVPAITMKLWAEERKSGTIELILTLPVKVSEVVIGKYLAAWFFIALALFLTFPIWLTVNYLGSPDNGAIISGYLGSLLMSGGFLAIGSCMSSVTQNQVIAFIISIVVCFIFLLSGTNLVLDFFNSWLPQGAVDAIASLSFLSHFSSLSKGVIDIRDFIYYILLIGVFIYINIELVNLKKGG